MEGIEARAETTPARPSGTVSARYYRPELDWFRFLAFCLVFILHGFAFETADYVAMGVSSQVAEFVCVPLVLAGGYGVDLFFALSAFLITQLLLMERDRTGTVHIRSFYIRRVLRIWPLYFAFVLVAAAIEILWRNNSYQYYGSLVLFVCNWYAMFLQVPDTVTGHLWSISVEEQFYSRLAAALGEGETLSVRADSDRHVRIHLCVSHLLHLLGMAGTVAGLDQYACAPRQLRARRSVGVPVALAQYHARPGLARPATLGRPRNILAARPVSHRRLFRRLSGVDLPPRRICQHAKYRRLLRGRSRRTYRKSEALPVVS